MPCNDTTSSITVEINKDDELVDYQYEKISCGKAIGERGDYLNFCLGKKIEQIADIPFQEALKKCNIENSEDEFLLYLEWKALRELLRQYLGMERDSDSDRYKIAEITADEDRTSVEMIIRPPDEMPPIISCGEMKH